MSKFDMNPTPSAPRISCKALRHAIELDFFAHPGRFLLRLVFRFVKGWAVTQLLCLVVLGCLLLAGLLLAPADFAEAFNSPGNVDALSAWFGRVIWLFASRYGVLTGFIFTVACMLEDGIKQVRYLSMQRGQYE